MDPQQRQWMAQEIARWRKNRLLPAAYCNFLAQLYDVPLDAPEEGSNQPARSWADRIASFRPMSWMVVFSFLYCFVLSDFILPLLRPQCKLASLRSLRLC